MCHDISDSYLVITYPFRLIEMEAEQEEDDGQVVQPQDYDEENFKLDDKVWKQSSLLLCLGTYC